MKYTLLLLIVFYTSNISKAQVSEIKKPMSLGVQSGILLNIPDANAKYIDKVWKKYMKEVGKIEKNKKAEEQYILNARISKIRQEAFDIYSSTEDNQMTVFFDMKNEFLNAKDNPKEFEEAKNFLTEFTYEVRREQLKDELEDESSKLKKSIKGWERLKKDNISYHKDIDEAKAKIRKAEQNILDNEKDQVKAKNEVETQTKVVEMVQSKLNNVGKSK